MQNESALPFSQACENNKQPIFAVLNDWFKHEQTVLEIGSGTGQHCVFFAEHMPWLQWLTADQPSYHAGIAARMKLADLPNLSPPVALEACTFDWNSVEFDSAFSANTAHIMSWDAVVAMFHGLGSQLRSGVFVLYGPFNRNGEFTSPSNAQFDRYLRSQDANMGIRDDQALFRLGRESGLSCIEDIPMPANNRILIWQKAENAPI